MSHPRDLWPDNLLVATLGPLSYLSAPPKEKLMDSIFQFAVILDPTEEQKAQGVRSKFIIEPADILVRNEAEARLVAASSASRSAIRSRAARSSALSPVEVPAVRPRSMRSCFFQRKIVASLTSSKSMTPSSPASGSLGDRRRLSTVVGRGRSSSARSSGLAPP